MKNNLNNALANVDELQESCIVIVHPNEPSSDIVNIFSLQGHSVYVATSRDRLIDIFVSKKVLFVFVDVSWLNADILDIVKLSSNLSANPFTLVRAATEDELDRILAIEMGADDCVRASCSHSEIKAKFRAFNRRSSLISNITYENDLSNTSSPNVSDVSGIWHIDKTRFQICSSSGARVTLTNTEYIILSALFDRPGEICDRANILSLITTDERTQTDRSLDVYIMRIRKKLARFGGGSLIETVKGKGYRLGDQDHLN